MKGSYGWGIYKKKSRSRRCSTHSEHRLQVLATQLVATFRFLYQPKTTNLNEP